ncbi:MAG: hypothetical protein KAS39_02725, partial [Actinomycetia bacterium]|nr:hypothetical protein [Actinomycetes bacterium]
NCNTYTIRNLEKNKSHSVIVQFRSADKVQPYYSVEKKIQLNGSDWTILVYLAAANNLEYYAISDMKEMEKSLLAAGDTPVIILFDRIAGFSTGSGNWKDTKLFELAESTNYYIISSKEISAERLGLTADYEEDLNMGDSDTLAGFISFCRDNYTATNYLLVLWNHGDGYRGSAAIDTLSRAICWDDEESSSDPLYTAEFVSALSNNPVDVIYMDACLMSMVEVAYGLRNSADFLVSSEFEIPAYGGNYQKIFNKFNAETNRTGEKIAKILIDSFYEEFAGKELVTTAIDLSKMDILKNSIDNLADSLKTMDINSVYNLRMNTTPFYRYTISYTTNNTNFYNSSLYTYIDIGHFSALCAASNISGAAEVLTALSNAVTA